MDCKYALGWGLREKPSLESAPSSQRSFVAVPTGHPVLPLSNATLHFTHLTTQGNGLGNKFPGLNFGRQNERGGAFGWGNRLPSVKGGPLLEALRGGRAAEEAGAVVLLGRRGVDLVACCVLSSFSHPLSSLGFRLNTLY